MERLGGVCRCAWTANNGGRVLWKVAECPIGPSAGVDFHLCAGGRSGGQPYQNQRGHGLNLVKSFLPPLFAAESRGPWQSMSFLGVVPLHVSHDFVCSVLLQLGVFATSWLTIFHVGSSHSSVGSSSAAAQRQQQQCDQRWQFL